MPTIEESVVISAPAGKIFSFMADATNAPVFDSSCIRCEPVGDGVPAVGSRWKGATKVLGRQFEWVSEYTELETDRLIAIKSVESKLSFQIRTQLTPEGDDTRVDYRLDADSGLGGVFGRLADPLVVKAQTRTVKANLASLKDLMESDAV
jgi:uncharacterized membrane protein